MPSPAYLLVLSEPGVGVSDELFNDWYDNEHVPLRVATPSFTSWVRLEAIDDEKPRFAAAYDLTSFEDTRVPPYTTLAETRSDREKDIFARSELFDRRIYELYDTSLLPPPSSLYGPERAAPITVFRGLDMKKGTEEELIRWNLEEHFPLLSKCPGWIRTRLFVLKEAGYVGVDAEKQTKAPPKFLSVHEWADADYDTRPEYRAALNTPWRDRLMKDVVGSERRVFKSTRQWKRDE